MGGVLIVTGSSRGIGAAIARRGAGEGYAVCVNYRARRDRADAIVGAIVEAGGRAVAIQADVGREADVRRLFTEVDQALGPVTALVNNVGIVGGERRVEDAEPAHLAHLFAVNVIGAFLCAREAIRRMAPRHGGREAPSSTSRRWRRSSAAPPDASTMPRPRARWMS
jgi:NAD(P)-dependent dehydrogenase (short-subunit alcohol dehydrogenase family)